MSAYVPPHLRFTGVSADIRNHEPRSLDAMSRQTPASGSYTTYTDHDIVHHFWPSEDKQAQSKQTLNGSEAHPGDLAFINIYLAGHPKWESNGIIFTKTALHLLPQYSEKLAAAREELKKSTGADVDGDEGDSVPKKDGDSRDEKDGEQAKGEGSTPSTTEDKLDVAALETKMAEHHVSEGAVAVDAAREGEGESESHSAKGKTVDSKGESEDQATAEAKQHPQQLVLRDIPPIDYTPNEHAPVAVFMTRGHSHYGFRFIGWFKITKIAILHRHSVELGRLTEQRWGDITHASSRQRGGGRRGWNDRGGHPGLRNEDAWKADLGREWAVLKLDKVETEIPEPVIEKRQVQRNRENEPIPGESEPVKGPSPEERVQRAPADTEGADNPGTDKESRKANEIGGVEEEAARKGT